MLVCHLLLGNVFHSGLTSQAKAWKRPQLSLMNQARGDEMAKQQHKSKQRQEEGKTMFSVESLGGRGAKPGLRTKQGRGILKWCQLEPGAEVPSPQWFEARLSPSVTPWFPAGSQETAVDGEPGTGVTLTGNGLKCERCFENLM